MEESAVADALTIARALETLGYLAPADWVDVAVAFLVGGIDDENVVRLCGFDKSVSGWDTDGPIGNLYSQYGTIGVGPSAAVDTVAGLLAADLRLEPANVTAPMIRMLAEVAVPHWESSLANQCFGLNEYLDCDCSGSVDLGFEEQLEALASPKLPATVVRALAAPLRATLPLVQPIHGH